MKHDPQELKDRLTARMLAPQNESVTALAGETQIPKDTLYGWRMAALGRVKVNPVSGPAHAPLSSEDKFAVVVETTHLNAHELGEYCRTHGLFTQQVHAWRERCSCANATAPSRAEQEQAREQAREIRQLRTALQRKEKALAEAAARRRTPPANALSPDERARLLARVNRPEFADLSPKQIVPRLADQGEYLASESTLYRLLRDEQQLAHRGKAKPATRQRPEALVATGANQVWTWDITYLATTLLGRFFYLYLTLDLYSRKIVGWEVHEQESAAQAANLFRQAYLREGVDGASLALHSDNGAPMKGATMLATLQRLGVVPSFSRPSVSNDNPYSEAMFRTLEYTPAYPDGPFASIYTARAWVARFVPWYNEEHRHSAIQFVTPGQRHRGEDGALLRARVGVYEAARDQNPIRWSGPIRNWEPIGAVSLDPGTPAIGGARTQTNSHD